MCGRFTQRMTWRELHERMGLLGTPLNLRPRYNVAPSQDVAIVRANDDGRSLCMLRWGLVPSWAREPNIGYKLINARSETAAEKPSFRSAYRHRRCLIPADGFYEWWREGKTRKPWLFGLQDGAPFAFAGLWERWTVPQGMPLTGSLAERGPGDTVETFTILTAAANETVAPVHGRMPVILSQEDYSPWLARRDIPLAPYPADDMTAHPVSALVNRPANDDPRCVEPITLN
ncbi:MAG: SOS response-associated peptidase [Rhodospirillales bacterium]|nr:SOS response-associated peptidase [Rhodospirillales bacterium]